MGTTGWNRMLSRCLLFFLPSFCIFSISDLVLTVSLGNYGAMVLGPISG